MSEERNVLGTKLEHCSLDPLTGWMRDGCCNTDLNDQGIHTVCGIMTDEFLQYLKQIGNDLSTPMPDHGFPGLKAGDSWCLCAWAWLEAYRNGKACKVNLKATHEETLVMIKLDYLKEFSHV
jgi:uncharacterized protein (DUF2237 family)